MEAMTKYEPRVESSLQLKDYWVAAFAAGYAAAQRWISVQDRVPEFGDRLVAAYKSGAFDVVECAEGRCDEYGYHDNGYTDSYGEPACDSFTHWLPLPPPPMQQNEEVGK